MASSKILLVMLLALTAFVQSEKIKCDGDCECSTSISGESCTLKCKGKDSCKDGTLQCRSGDSCKIKCDGESACSGNTVLDSSAATDVTMICDGKDSCKGNTAIICGTGAMNIECTHKSSCIDASLSCDSASSFICEGHCPEEWVTFTSNPTTPITLNPTLEPTLEPTVLITSTSSTQSNPSSTPTDVPSIIPSLDPTLEPTPFPTPNPSFGPSVQPTSGLTIHPTVLPTSDPTQTTGTPTGQPSEGPTMQPTAMPIVACGEHLVGDYDNAVVTFNIDVQATSTIIFNATKSTGEWVQSLVGLEVYLPDGQLVTDGEENDLHSNDFLVLGIEDGEPGIYELVFFVGSLEPPEDPRDGYYGSYNINVSCILDELSEDSHSAMLANKIPSSNWFSLNNASGSIKLSEMDTGVLILWVAVVLLCSVGTAIALFYTKDSQLMVHEAPVISDDDIPDMFM